MKRMTIAFVLLIVFGSIAIALNFKKSSVNQPIPSASPTTNQVLGIRTKNTGCVAQNGLPDKNCSPGAAIVGVTKDQVCTPGYSQSVRNVPESEKNQVYEEYGIYSHQTGEYEVDHL